MRYVRKALLAGGFMFLGTLGGLMADGNILVPEVIIAAGAGLVAAGAVYRIPNDG